MPSKLKTKIAEILRTTGDKISIDIKDELRDQGHINSGQLIKSVKSNVQTGTDVSLNIDMLDYHKYVEHGVSASRIPFGGKSSNSKRSKYIEGLIKFFRNLGKSNKEARGAAFATAHEHKSEGMPTRASFQHSKNGRRLEFINESTKANKEFDLTEQLILDQVEIEADLILDDFEKSIR